MAENLYDLKPAGMPRQQDYTGHNVWTVMHPAYGTVDVIARDKPGAIATAAAIWGKRWQDYAFYAFCEVGRRAKSG